MAANRVHSGTWGGISREHCLFPFMSTPEARRVLLMKGNTVSNACGVKVCNDKQREQDETRVVQGHSSRKCLLLSTARYTRHQPAVT